MGTPISGWEGNIGSAPEFKEFPNGNKEPRRLLRINVYFDNSIPKEGGGYEDRGGFWANVEWWHKDASHYTNLFQKGMRVQVTGRAVMDSWKTDEGEFEALKVQATRVAILPHRISMVNLAPSQGQSSQQNSRPQSPSPSPSPSQDNAQRNQPDSQGSHDSDFYPDSDPHF